MADAVISVVLQQITAILSDTIMQEMSMCRGLKGEVKKLETYLHVFRSALEDAEQLEMVDGPIKLCLEDLKILCYDIEDVLQAWERNKSGSFPGSLYYRVKSQPSISAISSRIENICERLRVFEMTNKLCVGNSKIKSPRNRETTSYGDLSKVIGRDEIKTRIVSCLPDANEQGTRTISIVGMGGIGKTALARLIYHDTQLIYKDGQDWKSFDKKIWVCVSNDFDTIKIAQAIILAFGDDNRSAMYLQASVTLQYLLERITKTIKEITFFLVLDDVWSINDNEGWEQLQAVLKQSKAGSRILVTTRKLFVAKRMSEPDLIYQLSDWPELDSWSMLDQFVFDGKDQLSEEERKSLRNISMKCKGLPLVAKALGNFLQKQPLEWGSLQHKELWQLEDVWKLVMPSLLLSYLDLPSKIKLCFLYCAIFPKGLQIRTDNLINHWMAQDYLICGTNVDMEDTGREFFSHLASCCLFQDFEEEGDTGIVAFKIHDTIHDLAQYLTRKDFVKIELTGLGFPELQLPFDDARHLTIIVRTSAISKHIVHENLKFCSAHKLRSLVAFSTTGNRVETPGALLQMLKKVRLLKVIDLGWNDSSDLCHKIQRNIGNLQYLRHLGLFHCETIQELPSIICKLHDLLSLDLHGCNRLNRLPDDIGDLINLRFLRTTDCFGLSSYPKGIGRLTSLRTLTDIIARAECNNLKEFCLRDLENMNNLCGNLRLKLMGNAIDVQEANKAELQNKTRLREIKIYLDGGIDHAAATTALNPHHSMSVRFFNHSEWWNAA